ncbi:RBBP9/YdeN family alpha/beta hydrolase [Komagataeibacter oboediens]|nr:alpha/beta hydrolase [Komagataeibacter oboediens]
MSLHMHPEQMPSAIMPVVPSDMPPAPDGRMPAGTTVIQALSGFDVVIVPGLDGSGPQHWQSQWELFFRMHGVTVRRVQQDNWTHPHYPDWVQGLQHAVQTCHRPVILVAHSLGAILGVRMAIEQGAAGIVGAFLVAPADIDHHHGPEATRVAGFAPLPATPLPFPAVLMASQDDEWLSMPRARDLAARWGATLIDAGAVGHIGNHARVGLWPDGMTALENLVRLIRQRALHSGTGTPHLS